MNLKLSTNPFDRAVSDTIPLFVLFDLVTEIRNAYRVAASETLENPLFSAGITSEHFPQERRFRVQQALVTIALKHSRFLKYDEKKTKPKGGRFVTLVAENLLLIEKFLSNPSKLPVRKYVSYLTAQPSIFEPELESKDPIFAVIIHGYDKISIFPDAPDFIDIIFPDPVDPANLKSALHRIKLMDLEFTPTLEESIPVVPETVITLKSEVELPSEVDPERGELK